MLKIDGEHKSLSLDENRRRVLVIFFLISSSLEVVQIKERVADSLLPFYCVCFSLSIFLGRVQEESGCLMVLLKLMSPGVRKLLL